MDDSPEDTENTNAQDNSETTGNTAACPGTWLIVVVLLVTAAAIAVAAFALYQWRRCAQADAQADMSVEVEGVATMGDSAVHDPYTAISQWGLNAYRMGDPPEK